MNKSKNSILLVDPDFDPNTAPDCHLLFKITADSLSYAVIDKNSRQLKAVFDQQQCEDLYADLATALKKDSYLQLPFAEVKVSAPASTALNIPDQLYNEQDLTRYTNFFADAAPQHLYIRHEAKFSFTSLFTLDHQVDSCLNHALSRAAKYEHHAPVLALASEVTGTSLLLDFTAGSFNALLVDGAKMKFQNNFQIDNTEEFNYYLLLMIQELHIDMDQTTVLLSGIIHPDDKRYSCLQKYFSSIKFNTPLKTDIDHSLLEDMPPHYYSSLLAFDLCV